MNSLNIWLTFSLIFTLLFWKAAMPKTNEAAVTIGRYTVPLLFLFALVLRVILAGSYVGFGVDIGCFTAWADRMVEVGPAGFYAKDYFSDYPPLYLYVLYFLGLIKKWLSLETYSAVHLVLLKSPAILADIGIGYLLYRTCNRLVGLRCSLCLTCLYLFQPIVLLNSCLWGQIDSLFTLFLLLVCLFLERQNLLPAMLFFGFGVLLKPQMLIFTPVLIVGVLKYVFRGSFSLHMLMKALSFSLLTLILVLLTAAPFGMENVIPQYIDTLTSYPYASVNAYNFWAAMGLNWHPQDTLFFGMPASSYGFIAIVLAAGIGTILGLRLGNLHQKYALTAAFLIITVFTFSVRMHERYLYPVLPLLLLSFAGFYTRQLSAATPVIRDGEFSQLLTPTLRFAYPILFTLITCLHFYNCGHVLFYYDPNHYDANAPILKFTGIGMTLCALFFYLLILRLQSKKEKNIGADRSAFAMSHSPLRISKESMRLTRADLGILLIITILYSVFALRDLGSTKAPTSVFSLSRGQTVTFTFPKGQKACAFAYYIAPEHDRSFLLSTLAENAGKPSASACSLEQVFTWQTQELLEASSSVSLTAQDKESNLIELVFLDELGNPVLPQNAGEYPALFDEQELYPSAISFRNGMYFDEIYHARTAYEFLKGLRSYENTHPPLGKIFISIGILLFGMNPFGWRIVGTVFGILMIPMLFLFAKRLTGDTATAALSSWIFAFDFMHFAQTRIATIDVYIVFFVICMYYFLFYFMSLDYGSTPANHLKLPLSLCGISMGLGVACKWTGVYAGLGMGILFFLYVYAMYKTQKKIHEKSKNAAAQSNAFWKKTRSIFIHCIIFFVMIPLAVYILSYLPFRDGSGNGLIKRALDNQVTMFTYHSNLQATHYFASPFYEWPLIVRPIWYYSGILSDTLREGISSFGNPLVWWMGIPALFYMFYLFLRKKDHRAFFLILGFLAQYLPWFFVKRLTFIYHYFPSVVFLVLMIGYGLRNLKELLPRKGYLAVIILYGLFVFGLFLLFYPVLAGQPVELSFAVKYLKWFKTWVLVAGK